VFFGFEWIKPTFLIYFLSIYEHARKDKKLFSRKMYNCICEVLDLVEKSLPLSVSIVVLKAFPPSHYTGTCAYRFVKFGPFISKTRENNKNKIYICFHCHYFFTKNLLLSNNYDFATCQSDSGSTYEAGGFWLLATTEDRLFLEQEGRAIINATHSALLQVERTSIASMPRLLLLQFAMIFFQTFV